MIGIVLISHGDLAKGIVSSASMLTSSIDEGLKQVETVTLWPDDNPDDFQAKLQDAVKKVDTGDGVFILADMLGGTPSNRAMYFIGEKVRMLAGLSLPMLYSLLNMREESTDIAQIAKEVMEEAAEAMVDVNELTKNGG